MASRPSPDNCAGVIVAGGSGSRAGLGHPKQYAAYRGTSVLAHAVGALRAAIGGSIAVVVPAGDEARARATVGSRAGVQFVAGGETRQDSVRAGLDALAAAAPPPQIVLIHDAARPDLPLAVVERVVAALAEGDCAIPVLAVTDSIVKADQAGMGEPVDRDSLRRAQTPQGFRFAAIVDAHRAWKGAADASDDSRVARAAGLAVRLVEGDARLEKLTFRSDFPDGGGAASLPSLRIGSGYDVHRLVGGDGLWLCGLFVPHDRSLAGHSDADVALHALTDAVFGAMARGDIGGHFPPSDPRWRGAESAQFLRHALALAGAEGFALGNADLTIICERPRIGPHREAMRHRIAEIAGVDIATISVKATTTERLGFAGREEGIAAQAQVLLVRGRE